MKYKLLGSEKRGISGSFLLLFVFIILKIIRNTINYNSNTNGGIWNAIVALYVLLGFLYVFENKDIRKYMSMKVGVLLSAFTFLHAVLQMQALSVNSLYYLIVSTFYVYVMILFFCKPLDIVNRRQNQLISILILIVQLLLLVTYVRYFSAYKYYQSSGYISLDNAYYGICLLPLILKYRSRVTVVNLFLLMANAIISSKRAGLIAIVSALLLYYWIAANTTKKAKKIKMIVLGIIVLLLFYAIFQYIDERFNLDLLRRLSSIVSDGGSGRSIIYTTVWNEYEASNLGEQIFGHGLTSIVSMTTLKVSSAHNDFLNILYESGIIPALLYILFVASLIVQGAKMMKSNYQYAPIYISTIPICLALTAFSSFFCSASCSIILAAYWGMEMRDFNEFKISRLNNVSKKQ